MIYFSCGMLMANTGMVLMQRIESDIPEHNAGVYGVVEYQGYSTCVRLVPVGNFCIYLCLIFILWYKNFTKSPPISYHAFELIE